MLTGQFHSTKMRMICILPCPLGHHLRNRVDDAMDIKGARYMHISLHGVHIGKILYGKYGTLDKYIYKYNI